jgi:hypothetical protein
MNKKSAKLFFILAAASTQAKQLIIQFPQNGWEYSARWRRHQPDSFLGDRSAGQRYPSRWGQLHISPVSYMVNNFSTSWASEQGAHLRLPSRARTSDHYIVIILSKWAGRGPQARRAPQIFFAIWRLFSSQPYVFYGHMAINFLYKIKIQFQFVVSNW